jgi:hypothetical protein
MGLLSKLLGTQDPTATWPAAGPPPALGLEGGQVGPLKLGDPLEAAKPLGRPGRITKMLANTLLLEYDAYDLEFKDARLVCTKFDLDDRGDRVTVAGFALSGATTPLDIKSWFGDPTSDSTGAGNLRWIDYERDGCTLALEFEDGKLRCVQLYAEGYA